MGQKAEASLGIMDSQKWFSSCCHGDDCLCA